MGAEGYCVNMPWSRGKVGDNDYIFAFQHAVMPIGNSVISCWTLLLYLSWVPKIIF